MESPDLLWGAPEVILDLCAIPRNRLIFMAHSGSSQQDAGRIKKNVSLSLKETPRASCETSFCLNHKMSLIWLIPSWKGGKGSHLGGAELVTISETEALLLKRKGGEGTRFYGRHLLVFTARSQLYQHRTQDLRNSLGFFSFSFCN